MFAKGLYSSQSYIIILDAGKIISGKYSCKLYCVTGKFCVLSELNNCRFHDSRKSSLRGSCRPNATNNSGLRGLMISCLEKVFDTSNLLLLTPEETFPLLTAPLPDKPAGPHQPGWSTLNLFLFWLELRKPCKAANLDKIVNNENKTNIRTPNFSSISLKCFLSEILKGSHQTQLPICDLDG